MKEQRKEKKNHKFIYGLNSMEQHKHVYEHDLVVIVLSI